MYEHYSSLQVDQTIISTNLAEILASAEITFVNLNLSGISAETKISDLSKIVNPAAGLQS